MEQNLRKRSSYNLCPFGVLPPEVFLVGIGFKTPQHINSQTAVGFSSFVVYDPCKAKYRSEMLWKGLEGGAVAVFYLCRLILSIGSISAATSSTRFAIFEKKTRDSNANREPLKLTSRIPLAEMEMEVEMKNCLEYNRNEMKNNFWKKKNFFGNWKHFWEELPTF